MKKQMMDNAKEERAEMKMNTGKRMNSPFEHKKPDHKKGRDMGDMGKKWTDTFQK